MPDKPLKEAESSYDPYLRGTTYKVYRYLLKSRDPVGISQVQKALGLSSSSVSEYHVKKLLRLGLIREEGGGYVVDKVVLENVVRLGRVSVPVQTGYAVFFGAALLFLVLFLRPNPINSLFFFALVIDTAAVIIS